jgi:cell division protein FtsB
LAALPTGTTLPIIGPFSGRLDHHTDPDHVLSTSEPKASRAKVHLAAPDRVIWIVVGGIVLWGLWAFGSELMLNLRLNHEVQSLRDSNARLSAANDQTRRELAASGSPASLEESARKAGFSRPGEQVYVIVKPSGTAAPTVGGTPSLPVGQANARNQDGGVIGAVERWWSDLWH